MYQVLDLMSNMVIATTDSIEHAINQARNVEGIVLCENDVLFDFSW